MPFSNNSRQAFSISWVDIRNLLVQKLDLELLQWFKKTETRTSIFKLLYHLAFSLQPTELKSTVFSLQLRIQKTILMSLSVKFIKFRHLRNQEHATTSTIVAQIHADGIKSSQRQIVKLLAHIPINVALNDVVISGAKSHTMRKLIRLVFAKK